RPSCQKPSATTLNRVASPWIQAEANVRYQQLNQMTDRELLGVLLRSPIDMLVSGSAIHKRSAPPTNVRFRTTSSIRRITTLPIGHPAGQDHRGLAFSQ